MTVSRRVAAASLLAPLAAALLPPSPAAAAQFGAAVPAPCVQEVSAVSTGTVFAAGTGGGSCAGQVQVSRRDPGGSFRQVAAWPGDYRVLDVAADGAATFVVLAQPDVGSGERVLVGKVLHGGRPSPLTELGASEGSVDASVVASGGRWAVAWTEVVRDLDRPGSGGSQVRVRGTLLGGAPQSFQSPGSTGPSLALGRGTLVLVFTADGDEPLRRTRAQVGGSFEPETVVPAGRGATAFAPEVVVSGGTEVLAWVRDGRPVLALGEDAPRALPSRGQVQDLQLAASGGSAFVVTEERFSLEDAPTSRVYARDVRTAGLRSTTELPVGPKPGDAQVRLHDVTAAQGRATVTTAGAVSTSR